MKAEQTIYTLSQAADYLQITVVVLMQWVIRGLLAGVPIDGDMRFHRDHLDQFLKELAEKHRDAMKPPPVGFADAEAGQEEKGLMNVRAALVADPQSAKSVKPPEGSFDDPTPAAKPFA